MQKDREAGDLRELLLQVGYDGGGVRTSGVVREVDEEKPIVLGVGSGAELAHPFVLLDDAHHLLLQADRFIEGRILCGFSAA